MHMVTKSGATEYATYREFPNALRLLRRRGGKFQKAAERIDAINGRIQVEEDPFHGVPTTNHGESRIRHCVKYDLIGFARLVTYQSNGYCIFLYCGTHDDVERWLDSNRGFVPVIDADFRVTATYASDGDNGASQIVLPPGSALGPLYSRLPEDLFERLVAGLPRRVMREVEQFESTVTDKDLWSTLAHIPDGDHAKALFDVLALLRGDKPVEARHRARLYLGENTPLEDLKPEDLPALVDSEVIRRIRPNSPAYQEAIRRFTATARYRDWMMFMHPEQESVVLENFAGPAKLVGVSGSGKTCVVIQRAVRLARDYPGEKILVLTINRPLAALISLLVETCATDDERERIDVRPFSHLCKELLRDLQPHLDRHYDDVTWRTNEHIDEIWQEYYRCETNNDDAKVLHPVHDSLLARQWNPERYLREEFDWLRSALREDEREEYMTMPRVGRTVNLQSTQKEAVLAGLRGWEDKMSQIGAVDGLGVAHAVVPFLEVLAPRYRCVLVDEAQDFGNVELEIVRRLVAPGENDLFLCGDAAQAVTTKFQSFKRIGIDIPGARSRRLMLNYRNSRDILAAAHAVLLKNMTEEMIDREDFDILDPEFSSFSASSPLLLEAASLEEEIGFALAFVGPIIEAREEGKACIAICGFSNLELAKFGERIGVPVLDGLTSIENGRIFLSDLEQTKGFEFDVVCVLNCSAGVLPAGAAPESEQFRDLARLYVAMTRAKTDLVLSWSSARSPFLMNLDNEFLCERWETYSTGDRIQRRGSPERLEAHRPHGMHRKKWWAMTGDQFLYTEWALGLSPELIARIRRLVDGKGLIRERQRVRFKTMGVAADEFRSSASQRLRWGPTLSGEFGALLDRLELAAPRARTGEFPTVGTAARL